MSAIELLPTNFNFTKSGAFLKGNADLGVTIDAGDSPAIAMALRDDTSFPPGTLHFGTVSVKASAGSDVQFDDGHGTVSFSAGGSVGGGLGIYSDATDLLKDLGGDTHAFDDLRLGDPSIHRFAALYWQYNAKAAAKGSLALGFGASAKFGVDASSGGLYAVVRAFKEDPKARMAIDDILFSWRLPRQVNAAMFDGTDAGRQFRPGTWLIAEVDGQFAATLGASYGYDFNWIRRVGLQGLSGDVGLKIQAAVEVELGFSASGKYLLIVSRDSLDEQKKIARVRLHKMSSRGVSFALDASLSVQGSTGKLLPDQLDQLISGLFGTTAPQIVEDLKILRQIGDPAAPLNKLAGDFLVDFAQKELSTVTDVQQKFDEAKKRVVGFLDIWDQLGPKSAGILWNAVKKRDPNFVKVINGLADVNASVQDILEKEFAKVDFFRTPTGQLIEAMAATSTLAMLQSQSELQKIGELATRIKSVLDGNVLSQLTRFVDDKFGLDRIRTLTLDQLDLRLKEKLSDFLARPLDNPGLQKVRGIISELEKKADKLYAEALKALNDKYTFHIHATYQKTTTKDALLDVSFDFGQSTELSEALQTAIGGDFQAVLKAAVAPNSGVTINAATLTHAVTRHIHVDFNLPYFSGSSDHLNEVMAKLDFKAEDGGLYLFDVTAVDEQTQVRNNLNRWSSRLAINMKLAALAGSGIRDYGDLAKLGESMTVSYGFKRAIPAMTTTALLHQLGALQPSYFPNEFGVPGKPSLLNWVTDLDKLFDEIESNGTGQLGNTLLSVQVTAPGRVLASWLAAPANDKDPAYLQMSRNIQSALKRLLPYCYFQDLTRYKGGNSAAAAVLLYAAIPPINSIHLESGQPIADSHPSPHWDVFDVELVRAMANKSVLCIQNFAKSVGNVNTLLQSIDPLKSHAQFYADDQIGKLRAEALGGPGLQLLINSILFTEAEVIKSAVNAGKAMADFRTKPADGLEHLVDFSHKLTVSFNSHLTDLFNAKDEPDLLRNFGLLVFVEASRALANLGAIQPSASLDLAVLRTKNAKGAVPFPPEGFPNNDPVPAENIGVEQRILAL